MRQHVLPLHQPARCQQLQGRPSPTTSLLRACAVCSADIPRRLCPQVFGQFGNLAGPRAVNLKSQKDKPSFAFIEFAQASSASTAISTSVSSAAVWCRV